MKLLATTSATFVVVLLPSLLLAQSPTFEDQVMEIVNQERWNNGNLPPLKRNNLLDTSSETHSDNMAARNFFAHCDPDNGTLPWDRMTAAGYIWNSAAENIAAGYSSPAAVMAGWMASSGHRANILSTSQRELGIGYVLQSSDQGNVRLDSNTDCIPESSNNGPYFRYWTQNFGRRNTVYPVVIDREAFQTINAAVSLYVYGTGWAQDMRIRNESGSWSAWQAFSANAAWVLSPGNGTKTVFVEIRNGATVYGSSDDILLNASADLSVSVTDSPDPVDQGLDLTYRVIVTNNGASSATNVAVTDVLPAGVAFVGASSGCGLTGGTVTCNLGTLLAGASDTVEIVVTPSTPGTLENTVTVSADELDPQAANNSATASTTVEEDATAVPGDDQARSSRLPVLRQNAPNPFSSRTHISWFQPAEALVRITIHDVSGSKVATLVDASYARGDHAIEWGGRDDRGRELPAGVLIGRLEIGGHVRVVKLLLSR